MTDFQVTSTVFHYIVKKLNEELCLGYINNVQTVDKNVWKIKIHKKKTKELIITPFVCFIPKTFFPVSEILGFEKYLKKKLYNQRIKEIYQHKNNKVICFKLDKYNLIFEFFSKSNIILTDLDLKIITSKQKEEWKDRIIKKNETYVFPKTEDIKEQKKENIEKEINGLDMIDKIRFFSKKYNIAPIEINNAFNKGDGVENIFKNYNLKEPKVNLFKKEDKLTYYLSNKGEEIFDCFEDIYKNKYEEIEIVKENTKKEKSKTILDMQENKKKEILTKIKQFEKEGEFVYENFSLIENINKQISLAIDKKITDKEIITKINDYFIKNNINLKITSINRKNKSYEIEK